MRFFAIKNNWQKGAKRRKDGFSILSSFKKNKIIYSSAILEQVLDWANDTEFGLVSYVFTNHIKNANFYAENLEFGLVGINEWAVHGTELPFVGIKSSGIE
jgi:succinate-semialdehyde dehydrogenase/glutarate-semialdehyde dehydrogenase